MIRISFWASKHQLAARALLAVFHIALFSATVFVAVLLDQINVHLHYTVPLVALGLLVASIILYPAERKTRSFLKNYLKRKSCEFVFLWSTLICVCFVFNNDVRVSFFNSYQTLNGSFVSSKDKVTETRSKSNVFSKKTVKQQFKELLKELKRSKKASGDKAGLIILTILGGLALTFVVLALSCSLACNGSEGLAIAVLIGGVAAVIFLMVFLIKKINQSHVMKEETIAAIPDNPASF